MAFRARRSKKPWGRRPFRAKREEYFRLVRKGYSVSEASKLLGIHQRTGYTWLHGRPDKGIAPADQEVEPDPVGSGRYLRLADRMHIADRLLEKASVRTIAAELSRSPSTVSREIRRNCTVEPSGRWRYRPYAAQWRAEARRPRPKPGKITQNTELREAIQQRLDLRWSPEQVCHALRAQFPDRPEMHVVHETVYQALYIQGRGELRREVARALRCGRARRKPQRRPDVRRSRFPHRMVMISERPPEAEDRAVPGHWEGDLIIGKNGNSAIGTLVERATRYVMLLHLPHGRTAEAVRDGLTDLVQTLPGHLTRSLTWDQGTEMAHHHSFTVATDVPVYFCDPASPWQRGSNENTNGLLRQYFPKGTDLSVHTREHLNAVAAELNGRPRKTLDWNTPAQRLHRLLEA